MFSKIKTDIVIVGAGISGLATAHFLISSGYQVLIIEQNERVGGAIRSRRLDGFLVEDGPNSVLDTMPLLHRLFKELEIDGLLEYANQEVKNRYILRNDQLQVLPMNPVSFLKSNLFSNSAKFRLLKEPFISASNPEFEESLAEFVNRRLGQEFLDYAVNPFVAGIYAGIPENLSVQNSFPKLFELEQTYGSLIKGAIKGAYKRWRTAESSKQRVRQFSFQDGMQTLIGALQKKLSGKILTNTRVDSIRKLQSGFELDIRSKDELLQIQSRALLFTIPAYNYEKLTFEFELPIQKQLSQICYPPIAMVFFGYLENPAKIPLDGFGFLVPEKEKRNILGTIWNSTIFSNRAPTGGVALTTFVGGSRQPDEALKSEEQIINMVKQDLQEIMGIEKRPSLTVVKRWSKSIPQYNIGHQNIIDSIETFEKKLPGLYLSGNYRGGISVGDCVKQAYSMSVHIASDLKTSGSFNRISQLT